MNDLYCLYSGPVVEDGLVCGGAVNMKTREGLAVVIFASSALAQRFLELTGLCGGIILPLSQLGDAEHPNRTKFPLPPPSLKILFSSEDVLIQWHRDTEGFESGPFVTEFVV